MKITVETIVHAPIESAWRAYTTPQDIMRWSTASADGTQPHHVWTCVLAAPFLHDGSMGFDFAGTDTNVAPNKLIGYSFVDRHAKVEFSEAKDGGARQGDV